MPFVLGISGSDRCQGNTATLVNIALEAAEAEGARTELLELCEYSIQPCEHCLECSTLKRCKIDDALNVIVEKMEQAQGIIIGTANYYGAPPTILRNLLTRSGRFANLRGKVGGALAVSRRSGADLPLFQLYFYMLVKEMVIPGIPVWPIGYAFSIGEVLGDSEALSGARELGRRVAALAKQFEQNPLPWMLTEPTITPRVFGEMWL